MRHFIHSLKQRWDTHETLVCVGLDPDINKLPAHLSKNRQGVYLFCKSIIDATAQYACAFKPQIAYFSAIGAEDVLQELVTYIHEDHPGIPVVLDAKRGDIGTTAEQYAREAFERYNADAVTLNPYMGHDSARPFLDYADRGCIFLCHTSNSGAQDFQELTITTEHTTGLFYQHVAQTISSHWNTHNNCALVVGATFPEELKVIRDIVGEMPLLIPGIGAQGGDVQKTVSNGQTANGQGLMISASRSILYASSAIDFAVAAGHAAQALRDEINAHRISA